MLRELAEYIVKKSEPVVINNYDAIGNYTDKHLERVEAIRPRELKTCTLRSIVDYVKCNMDNWKNDMSLIVHVESPTKVVLTTEDMGDGTRFTPIVCEAIIPRLSLGWQETELMNICLQSGFTDTDDKAKVLSLIGNIADGVVKESSDDGVTQQVTSKVGIQRVGLEKVPNPVYLAPYRTFTEVPQPISPFVLRLRSGAKDDSLPMATLIESDGLEWRIAAIKNIGEFFKDELCEEIEGLKVSVLM